MKIKVKAEWLKACGRNPTHDTFTVKTVTQTGAAVGSGFDTMFVVHDPLHKEWTVARYRVAQVIVD